jgi:hypothetical protein
MAIPHFLCKQNMDLSTFIGSRYVENMNALTKDILQERVRAHDGINQY